MREINLSGTCRRCHKKLPSGVRSDCLYCPGGKCRVAAHRRRQGPQRARFECQCHWCGRKFEAISYWRKYCPGNACKQAAYRARVGAGKQMMF